MTGVKLHLDNKSFPTKKDIVAKANYIISECRELKIFIQQINDKSKDMHLVLGVNQDRTFNAILELDKLLELILKNPRPINNWFTNGKIQSINKLVDLAKAEQALIDNNLTGIRSIFRDDILNINYDELFIKFKTTYVHTLKAISDFNGLSDNLQLNKQTIL
jgi:hypothetical protein